MGSDAIHLSRFLSITALFFCFFLLGGLFGGGLGGRFGGGGAVLLLLLLNRESRLLLLLAQVELLVGVRRGLESGTEGGSLGRVGFAGRLLDLSRRLVHTLQLRLHEFASSLVDGESELVHVEVLLDEAVLDAETLLLRLPHPRVQHLALLDQILFFVALDVERRDDFGDGFEFGGILFRLFTSQVLLSLLQDEDLEHTLLLLGQLELAHG